jgi:hypothetical protein
MEMNKGRPRFRYSDARRNGGNDEGFESFDATALYCPKCKNAMPVRKKLLLILPGGDLYDLICTGCGASLGKKEE